MIKSLSVHKILSHKIEKKVHTIPIKIKYKEGK